MRKHGTVLVMACLIASASWGADKKISVKVSPEEYEALSKLAKEEKAKVADIVKEAIAQYLEANTEDKEKESKEKAGGEDKGGLVTTAKSRNFEVTVSEAAILQRIEIVEDYSFQDGYKYKTIESPKGSEFLKVDIDLQTFTWKKMQSLSGDGMVPGCILKWKHVSLKDSKKRGYPCVLMGGRGSKPWPPDSQREVILVKREDGSIRMMRRSQGWRLWNNGERLSLFFKVPEDSGPYTLKFMDVPPVDVKVD